MLRPESIPLSLYIHIPWCLRKCPYCDFNSHQMSGRPGEEPPYEAYVQALIEEWDSMAHVWRDRPLHSIFIGGGTPSLMPPKLFKKLLDHLARAHPLPAEITMEANPGTHEHAAFASYRECGITRLSIGVQSFSAQALVRLGRVHTHTQADEAIRSALQTFERVNLDIMFALPSQTLQEAMDDLQQAMSYQTKHLSWYQLTLEPDTAFFHKPPAIPQAELAEEMYFQGRTLLDTHGFQAYEVSAYQRQDDSCVHNVNYWQYGDYLGIGAGAHSKITQGANIWRRHNVKGPRAYMARSRWSATTESVPFEQRAFEFFLNHTRLRRPIQWSMFEARTAWSSEKVRSLWQPFVEQGYLVWTHDGVALTEEGFLCSQALIEAWLPSQGEQG